MPFTAILTYALVEIYKAFTPPGSRFRAFIPIISIIIGVTLGIIFYLIFPEYVLAKDLPMAAIAGGMSGLAATGSNQVIKNFGKKS